ncbi:hypothetical protein FZEAL_4686 [Fusarium zealandicum]|uniref:Uncharacterized protein n=1 Tax=Fusarium zealandicum TaxID=1053134 RepID=A0A8H4XLA8_9HYPO|nr:hypothetical protein FZEAL_4686 [Fusarium zealandicum]
MANGFDRLERFFAKKKTPAATPTEPVKPVMPATSPPNIPQFPSPSFIRPKTSRMSAREEVRKQSGTRAPYFPAPPSPRQMGSAYTQSPTRSSSSSQFQYSPLRTTFMPTQTDSFLDGFDVYQFPRPPTHHGEPSPASSTFNPKSSSEAPSERSFRPQSSGRLTAGTSRLETPPSSDLDEDDIHGPRRFLNKKLPALPQRKPPTPESSPELRPVPESQLKVSKSIDFLNKAVYTDIRRQLAETLEQLPLPLRRALSQSSLAPSTSRLSLSSSTLREPDFNEFMNLSDDDIAESRPEGPAALDDSPVSSTAPSTIDSPRQSLLTLTPPYASKPATAAAFEAARIANRHNFDFVYVVNLWPGNARPRASGRDHDAASVNSKVSNKQPKAMSGRLLAAYGLENVKSPFQIDAETHRKILRTPGWIEYRNQRIRDDEFARGYACAFYTGEYSQGGSVIPSTSSSSARSIKTNRGIVFAAYRKPRANGSMVGTGSSPAELASIHQDAEALVEMLIDIHVANQLRQPRSDFRHSEETGPMPEERFGVLEGQ